MQSTARTESTTNTGFQEPTPEYPDDEQIRAYGALTFLYCRAPTRSRFALKDLRVFIQPPVDLRFYRIQRIEGVPRAAITWGYLGPEAEEKLRDSRPLTANDWASGTQLWIMDIIAPYGEGMGAQIMRDFLDQVPPDTGSVRFVRYDKGGRLKFFIEFRRAAEGKWGKHRLSPDQLKHGTQFAGNT